MDEQTDLDFLLYADANMYLLLGTSSFQQVCTATAATQWEHIANLSASLCDLLYFVYVRSKASGQTVRPTGLSEPKLLIFALKPWSHRACDQGTTCRRLKQ